MVEPDVEWSKTSCELDLRLDIVSSSGGRRRGKWFRVCVPLAGGKGLQGVTGCAELCGISNFNVALTLSRPRRHYVQYQFLSPGRKIVLGLLKAMLLDRPTFFRFISFITTLNKTTYNNRRGPIAMLLTKLRKISALRFL